MSPKPDVSQERTAQIIEAAMIVFARNGFNQARMDDIAQQTGLSKGTLYLYFKSKDDIIGAILNAILSRELIQARELVKKNQSAVEKLNGFLDIVLQDLNSLLPQLSIYFEFLALAMRREAIKKVIREYFLEFLAILTPIIEQGIARGEFRPVDPGQAALAIGAAIEGMVLLWAYDPDRVDLDENIRSSVDLILQGLKS